MWTLKDPRGMRKKNAREERVEREQETVRR